MHRSDKHYPSNQRRLVRRFVSDRRAIAVTEFALMLPILMMLFYGMVEITRYILIVQKTEKLAHTVADITAQMATARAVELDQVFAASSDIMNPFAMDTNGRILISSLYREQGQASGRVNWRYEGGGTLIAASRLGAINTVPTMPGGFTFDERENLIAGEVIYRFTPLLSDDFFGETTVYRVAFYKPRLGALLTPPA
jgi:Flp pilus assembly protein TadG